MALQSQVNLYRAVGVQGGKATPDQSIYTPINYVAGEGGVTAGAFCYADADTEGVAVAAGTTVLGFVERVISASLYDVTANGSLVYPEGTGLTIAVKGDYYVAAPETVAVGDTVYADADTGAVAATGNDTGFVYKTAGDADELVIISNW